MSCEGKICQKRFATLGEHIDRRQSGTDLLFLDLSVDRRPKIPIISAPRRQALWLPFIHQMMLLMTVPEFFNQMDFQCNDDKSQFHKSQILNQFQPIRYTKAWFKFHSYVEYFCIFRHSYFKKMMGIGTSNFNGLGIRNIHRL